MPEDADQFRTLAFVVFCTISIIGFDVLAWWIGGKKATISMVMGRIFQAHPTLFIAFVFWLGVLVGHLKFPIDSR